ncbi:MAG: phage tail sheath family protein [Anaerolineae bacterium]|nr:phage tail sheath family protein [Anaerolineae bacterium]
MAVSLRYKDRVPGVVVEPRRSAPAENPYRLDIVGFVGFAERGPLDTPVLLEDYSQFTTIFGGDIFLARHKGQPVYAHLPSAVRAFFDNGGRRCYVVRVADNKKATANHFKLPGLLGWTPESGFEPAICPAAWVGRWSNSITVGTRVHARPLQIDPKGRQNGYNFCTNEVVKDGVTVEPETNRYVELDLRVPSATTVKAGDVLRVLLEDKTEVYLRAKEVRQFGYISAEERRKGIPITVRSEDKHPLAFAPGIQLPDADNLTLVDYRHKGVWYGLPVPYRLDLSVQQNEPRGVFAFDFLLVNKPAVNHEGNPCCCVCHDDTPDEDFVFPLSVGEQPDSADMLSLTYTFPRDDQPSETLELHFPIDLNDVNVLERANRTFIRITSSLMRLPRITLKKIEKLGGPATTEWVTLPLPLDGLNFNPTLRPERRYELNFESSEELLVVNDVLRLTVADEKGDRSYLFSVDNLDVVFSTGNRQRVTAFARLLVSPVDARVTAGRIPEQVDLLRFDLFIREGKDALEAHTQLNFGNRADSWMRALAHPTLEDKITSEDLRRRSLRLAVPENYESLFQRSRTQLELPDSQPLPLYLPFDMSEQTPPPSDFNGALWSGGKTRGAHDGLDTFRPINLFLDPEFVKSTAAGQIGLTPREINDIANRLLYFNEPRKRPTEKAGEKPTRLMKLHSLYAVDDVALISIPDLGHRRWRRSRVVRWWGSAPPQTEKPVLLPPGTFQPVAPLRWQSVLPAPSGKRTPLRLPRARVAIEPLNIYQELAALPATLDEDDECWGCETLEDILLVHCAMVNLCTARTDMLALLSLPIFYGLPDVLDWYQQIVCPRANDDVLPERPASPCSSGVGDKLEIDCPDDALDERALSHAIAYHGWLDIREERTPQLSALRTIPPDGPVSGMIAAREIARGPGIAPANEPLLGVVGLNPALTDAEWALLYDRQINVLRQRPGRFVALSAHTMTADAQLRMLSIRRLMIYLRKLVLGEGERYVFENNTERFRNAVQRRFEQIFDTLLRQGALVGYQVDTGPRVNTPNDIDNGRLFIEIRIAPTYPVEYITIVLLRSGENTLELVER